MMVMRAGMPGSCIERGVFLMRDEAVTHKWPLRRWEMWVRQVLIGSWLMRMRFPVRAAAWVWRRLMWRTTFIAITGSLGKTTCKEMLAAILKANAPAFATIGNQNGPQFVALNTLRVRPWHRYAVLELAGSSPGTLDQSAPVVRPDVAVVLGVYRTHSTQFVSLEEHAREKERLIEHAAPRATVVLSADDPFVSRMSGGGVRRVIRFGTLASAGFRAENVSAQWPRRLAFDLIHGDETLNVRTQLVGEHWLPSVLGALVAAAALGIPLRPAARAVASVPPFRGRLQPVLLPSGAIALRDDYNASLTAANAAFNVLRHARAGRRVLVLHGVSDFGASVRRRHRYVGSIAPQIADLAVFVGEGSDYACRRAVEAGLASDHVFGFQTQFEAAAFLKKELRSGDLVLFKGKTTDHLARVFFAQFASVACWKPRCPKTMLCDECWELGVDSRDLRRVVPVAAE
jgi:UDP-N-acetylmuramoyl-tripeptide--D-alanyl-D-alanine ligase